MDVFPSEVEIHGPLLAFLQDALGPCEYAEPPTPMRPGNDTQVHAFSLTGIDEPLVLRVFRREDDAQRPVFEATLQNALAEQGLPVPRAITIGSDTSVIGAPFFVMERASGRTLYGDAISTDDDGIPQADWRKALQHGGEMLFGMPRLLAEVCLRIHAIDAKAVAASLEAGGVRWQEITVEGRTAWLENCVEECALEGLRPAVDWLRENRPASSSEDVVCHCDVQPLNLMMEGGELRGILDWANAMIAPPELEVGWTRAVYLTLELPLDRKSVV
jgi:aminoglycoside phosphotransferase (APT) family kinase protein